MRFYDFHQLLLLVAIITWIVAAWRYALRRFREMERDVADLRRHMEMIAIANGVEIAEPPELLNQLGPQLEPEPAIAHSMPTLPEARAVRMSGRLVDPRRW